VNNARSTAAAVRHDPRNLYRSSPFGNKTGVRFYTTVPRYGLCFPSGVRGSVRAQTGNIRFCAVWSLESQAVAASCIYYNGGSSLNAPRAALQARREARATAHHVVCHVGCISRTTNSSLGFSSVAP
jgi:hypothetical protein